MRSGISISKGFPQFVVITQFVVSHQGFPCCTVDKESACNAGDLGSILGCEDPLEKGTVTHSSILVWRIPWTI